MQNDNYEQITETQSPPLGAMLNQRSDALATRLENGATDPVAFAAALSEAEWQEIDQEIDQPELCDFAATTRSQTS